MLDHEQREALGTQPAEDVEDLGAARRVEVRRRFVEHHDRRPEGEKARDREPLLLAAGERRRVPSLEAREADRGERAGHALGHRRGSDPGVLEREDHLLRHVGREELRLEVLEHHADRPGELAHARTVDRVPEEPDLPAELRGQEARHEPREAAGEGRLAGPRGAHDDGEGAGRHLARHAVERRACRPRIRAAEVADRDGRGGAAHRSARPQTARPRSGRRPRPTSRR